MLGLLYGMFVGVGLIGNKIKTDIVDIQTRDKAKLLHTYGMNRAGVYTDSRGRTRDLETGKLVVVYPDKYGDVWVEDFKGNKLRNITQERLINEVQKKAEQFPENRAVKYTSWYNNNSKMQLDGKYPVVGIIYKDIHSGELYITREIKWFAENGYRENSITKHSEREKLTRKKAEFYMKLSDGMLVDITDNYKSEIKTGDYVPTQDEITNFIAFFNEKQNQVGGWYNAYDYEHIDKCPDYLKECILKDTQCDKYLYSYGFGF